MHLIDCEEWRATSCEEWSPIFHAHALEGLALSLTWCACALAYYIRYFLCLLGIHLILFQYYNERSNYIPNFINGCFNFKIFD